MASCRPRAGTVVRLRVGSAGGAARAGAAASPRRSPTAGGVRPRFAEPPPILHIPSGPMAHAALVPKRRRQAGGDWVSWASVARRELVDEGVRCSVASTNGCTVMTVTYPCHQFCPRLLISPCCTQVPNRLQTRLQRPLALTATRGTRSQTRRARKAAPPLLCKAPGGQGVLVRRASGQGRKARLPGSARTGTGTCPIGGKGSDALEDTHPSLHVPDSSS